MTPETLTRIKALRKHVCSSCDIDGEEFANLLMWNEAIDAVLAALDAQRPETAGMPAVHLGDVVLYDDDEAVVIDADELGWCQRVGIPSGAIAIYRDPLWRREGNQS